MAVAHADEAVQAPQALTVLAAGSLRAAFVEIGAAFERAHPGTRVSFVFGASGLLKDRLLAGEPGGVFASANMAHPQALAEAGKAAPVQRFARNALCVLAHPAVGLKPEGLLAALLDPRLKLGTSTPGADPSGDYAFQMFDRLESSGAAPAGTAAALKARALQLTGGPQSPSPPPGRNVYGVLVAERQADLFVTYCTNATVVQREQPAVQALPVPAAWNVLADYGLAVLKPASSPAQAFADYVLSADGQAVLAAQGFTGR